MSKIYTFKCPVCGCTEFRRREESITLQTVNHVVCEDGFLYENWGPVTVDELLDVIGYECAECENSWDSLDYMIEDGSLIEQDDDE